MMPREAPLTGRTALVTGASRGIGRAIAAALSQAGAAVAINYHQHQVEAESLWQELAAGGGQAIVVRADVSRAADVARMVTEVEGAFAGVDIISSVAAHVGGIVGPHYAASKAGMHGLMRYYAAHLAREGITANAVAPALIDTDMIRGNVQARPDAIPVGRFGDPREVASAVLLVAENGYINGQVVNVDGGLYFG